MPPLGKRWLASRALLAALALPALAGCLAQPAAPPAPAVVAAVTSAPDPAPSVSPPIPAATATATPAVVVLPPPSPTALPTATVTTGPTAGATATPAATPTPAPTFTPPPAPPPTTGEHLILGRPVPADTSPWTDKVYPYGSTRGGTLQPHHGVEFNVGTGTPVLAAASGTVVVAGDDLMLAYGPTTNFYGNLVVIDHGPVAGQPLYTLYGHLSQVSVGVGEVVAEGQPIGLSGDSGVAYGPHLHFEVRSGANAYGATRNPLLWLVPLANTGAVIGRVTWPSGELAAEVPVVLRRVDGDAPYTAATSYAAADLNGDDIFGENFALDDVVPGYYQIQAGEKGPTAEFWVFPGRVTPVDLVLER